jgi:hypothetical protein
MSRLHTIQPTQASYCDPNQLRHAYTRMISNKVNNYCQVIEYEKLIPYTPDHSMHQWSTARLVMAGLHAAS